MLYVFDVVDSQYFKFGFTAQSNPWNRIQKGFWTNLHPTELCGKLGSQNLNLVHVFEGDYNLEKCIQSLFPPECGEFWRKDDLPKIIKMLRLMTSELEIPIRPDFVETEVDKLSCCSGELNECWICGKKFKRFCKLLQHKRDVHESPRFRCVCGLSFPRKGNLDRHVLKSCKGTR